VNGGFTNNGTLTMFGSPADTLKVSGTLTNNAGATLNLLANSSDVANVGTLSNSGSVSIGAGTTLNLTNQATGITDVPKGSTLTVNGTLKAGTANGLANLGSVEGTLNLGNGQTTGDTPGSGTLTVASGGSLVLMNSGTTLSVTGALSDAGSVSLNSGATLNLTKGMSNLTGQLFLQNGKTTTITPSAGTLTLASGSILEVSGASGLTVNGSLTNDTFSFDTGSPNGGGNTVTVNGGFTNNGTLTMFGSPADTLKVSGTLTNNAGATLNLLANSTDVANVGSLSNSGTVNINGGTILNVTGTGSKYTQTAGTTTDDGSLTLPSSGMLSLNGGSLFGQGTITGAVTSSSGGAINPGHSSSTPGILTVNGAYTQSSTGVLDISIGGTTPGSQYDQLNVTNSNSAKVNGTLNLSLINGFVPAIGTTFDILNASSVSGTFSTVNGTKINGSEHFVVSCDTTDCDVTVASGAGTPVKASTAGPTYSATKLGGSIFGLGGRASLVDFLHLGPRVSAMAAFGSPLVRESLLAASGALMGTTRSRMGVDFPGSPSLTEAGTFGLETRAIAIPPYRSTFSSTRLPAGPRAYLGHGVISAWELASTDSGMRRNVLNRIAVFAPVRSFSVGAAPRSLVSAGASAAVHNRINPTGALLRNNSHDPRMVSPKSLEYHIDLLSMLGTGRRHALRGLLGQPGNFNASGLGYLTFSGSH